MEFTTVRELYHDRASYVGKEITVGGWVRSNRDSKTFGFIVLHDGTFFETLQIVYHDTMANFQELTKINVGAAVIVKGTLVPTPEAKQPLKQLHALKGCQAHTSVMLSSVDIWEFRKLGIELTCEPKFEKEKKYH